MNSLLHRADPRVKILFVMAIAILIFVLQSVQEFIILAMFTFVLILASKIPIKVVLRGFKSILLFISLTSLLNIFFTSGRPIFSYKFVTITYEGIYYALLLIFRMFFLMIVTSLLTLTTSPLSLTDGIESLMSPLTIFKFPAHEFAMMISIALRFVPTLFDEIDKIMKAQASRGADFESKNLIKKMKAMSAILVPLFVNSFRRADELATAMESRGYQGGKNRTKLHQLKLSSADACVASIFAIFVASELAAKFWM
jgi:energy-coupling factor transport system permease protein